MTHFGPFGPPMLRSTLARGRADEQTSKENIGHLPFSKEAAIRDAAFYCILYRHIPHTPTDREQFWNTLHCTSPSQRLH
jgi:hypothetical protein